MKLIRGDRIRNTDDPTQDEYIVAQVDDGTFALINTRTGNRWEDPIKCELKELHLSKFDPGINPRKWRKIRKED